MRIIGGTLKGKKLVPLRGMAIRPTADRTREAIFNIIGTKIDGAQVLDLFAGTGAFGLEALSRNSAQAVFIDHDAGAIKTIEKNITACGMQDRAQVICWDITRNLKCLGSASLAFDIVFMDPPYNRNAVLPTLRHLSQGEVLNPGAAVIVEHSPSEIISEKSEGFTLINQRRYGKTLVSFLSI